MSVVLFSLILVSAAAQVAAVHWHRQWVGEWQQQDKRQVFLQQDYGRLLLEKNTFAAHGRVERIARDKLNMMEPEQVQVITVKKRY